MNLKGQNLSEMEMEIKQGICLGVLLKSLSEVER